MNHFFRFGTGVYGDRILLGANWDLFWWFVAAAVAFMIVHALSVPVVRRQRARAAERARRT